MKIKEQRKSDIKVDSRREVKRKKGKRESVTISWKFNKKKNS